MTLKLLLLALPVTLFAGTVTLPDGTDTVTTNGNSIQIGTCTTSCLVSGTLTQSGYEVSWSITTSTSITDSPVPGSPGNYTLSGPNPTGTLAMNDAISGGGDSLTANINMTSLTLSGTGMTLFGTLTVPSGGETLLISNRLWASFNALTNLAGITYPVGVGGETENLTIGVTNCMNGQVSSPCVQASDPVGTLSGVGLGAPASVPEPGTVALFGLGLVGLAWTLHRRKRA